MYYVDIDDNVLDSISDLTANAPTLLYKGAVVAKDCTFRTLGVLSKDMFYQLEGLEVQLNPVIWLRSKHPSTTSWSGNSTSPDALKFKANRSVIICGFLWHRKTDSASFKLKFSFRVDDGPKTDYLETVCQHDDLKDFGAVEKFHLITFAAQGIDNVKLS